LGLIFMAIVSGLTISTINNSTLIEEISFNTQEIAHLNQMTENVAALSLGNSSWVNRALNVMDEGNAVEFPTYEVQLEYNSGVTATTSLSAFKEIVPGYTVDSESDLSFIRLQIDSDTTMSSLDMSSKMTYGYMRLGAGG